jgi:hypothetical protein
MMAPAYMNGQRAPFNGPSESQPQESAMTMKIAVFGSGTMYLSALEHSKEPRSSFENTVVDLRHRVFAARYRCWLSIEAL